MGKKILVIGHAFIVEANRKVWSKLGEDSNYTVDLVAPKFWTSNLLGKIELKSRKEEGISNIFAINTYNTGNGSFYFYHIISLLKVLRNSKYDSIIINQEGWSLSLFFIHIVRFFTQNRTSKVYLMIAQNIKKNNLRWAIPLERFNLKFVTHLLGCCNETEDVIRWKNISTPWSYFPLCYGEGLETIKKNISTSIRLGYIGRISEEKGIDSLLKAFQTLQKKLENIELIIAGGGPLENELNIPGVTYLGVIPHQSVNDFYSQIDLLVLPSLTKDFWKEQFGRVIVESVAAGRIVIGSNSGAIPEVLGHIGLDYIFEEGLSNSIVEQVERYIQEKDKVDIQIFQKRNKEMFSIDAFVKRTKLVLDEC